MFVQAQSQQWALVELGHEKSIYSKSWGTPNKISSHELNPEFILVLCFLSGK